MEFDQEHLRRLSSKSRGEFVRLLRVAAGLEISPSETQSESEDQAAARALWQAASRREGGMLFPPFEIPPFEYPSDPENPESSNAAAGVHGEISAPVVKEPGPGEQPGRMRRNLLRLAAALAFFALGIFGSYLANSSRLFRESGVRLATLEKEIVRPEALHAGRLLIAPARIESTAGDVELIRGMMYAEWSAAEQTIYSFDLNGSFDLRQPVNLRILHPLARIEVIGTRFDLDFTPTAGVLKLSEGSLRLSFNHSSHGESDRVKNLQAPAVLYFDSRHVHRIASGAFDETRRSPIGFPDDASLQRFQLSNGRTIVGFVVRGSGTELVIQQADGRQITVPRSELISAENL